MLLRLGYGAQVFRILQNLQNSKKQWIHEKLCDFVSSWPFRLRIASALQERLIFIIYDPPWIFPSSLFRNFFLIHRLDAA
jgi:hypothetical protein